MTKQSIYAMPAEEYGAKVKKRLITRVILAVATLLLNILLVLLRTEQTHIWFLLINILSDIGCGVYLVYDFSANIIPKWELWKLSQRRMEQYSGTITEIEPYTTRYAKLDCYCVRLGNRRTFLPENTLQLEVGSQVELTLSGNVIVEVTQ